MPIITRPPRRSAIDEAHRVVGIVGVVAIAVGALLGLTATAASAGPKPVSTNFHTDGANSYTAIAALQPSCNGIFGTPGSFPSSKSIASVTGSTIHYHFNDNPARADQDFQVQDCVLGYPASFFSASDFNADGTLKPGSYSKHDLSNGDELDTATLSGTNNSTAVITYAWTMPSSVAPGTWVCNFARDVNDQHQGGGNRKAEPACFQVPNAPGHVTASVTFNDPTCANENTASWDGSNTDKIDYSVTSGAATPGSAITVTASRKAGVSDTMDGGPTFTHTFPAAQDCENPPSVTANVTFSDPTCANGNVASWVGTNTNKLDYVVIAGQASPGSSIDINAVKKAGVTDTLTGTTEFTHTFTASQSCGGVVIIPTTTTVAPTTTTVAPTTTTVAPTTTTTEAPVLALTDEPVPAAEAAAVTVAPTTTTPTGPQLAFTGRDTSRMLVLAFGLLLFGTTLLLLGRRKPAAVKIRK